MERSKMEDFIDLTKISIFEDYLGECSRWELSQSVHDSVVCGIIERGRNDVDNSIISERKKN